MEYLEKAWIRGLISFILGGVIPEMIFVSTGDPNRPKNNSTNIMSLFLVIFIYFALTYIAKKNSKNKIS